MSEQYKRTAFTKGQIKNGNQKGESFFQGWRKIKAGMQTIQVFPTKKTKAKEVTIKSTGEVLTRTNMMAKITLNGVTSIHNFMWYPSRKKGYVIGSNLVCSLNGSGKTRKGIYVTGFFGEIKKR